MTDEDVKPFLARVKAKLKQGDSFEQAMRVGFKAVLVSPHFLFLREKNRGEVNGHSTTSPWPAGCRTSCGVRCPTRNCSPSPRRANCARPDTLRKQVERMLKDPKAAAFTENFAGQWLDLRTIDDTAPDPMLYPEYDDVLKVAMVKETLLFFDEVLKNDLSLTNFVASDFTMLNGPLGAALRHPRRDGPGVPEGDAAAGQPPRRRADDGRRA